MPQCSKHEVFRGSQKPLNCYNYYAMKRYLTFNIKYKLLVVKRLTRRLILFVNDFSIMSIMLFVHSFIWHEL